MVSVSVLCVVVILVFIIFRLVVFIVLVLNGVLGMMFRLCNDCSIVELVVCGGLFFSSLVKCVK